MPKEEDPKKVFQTECPECHSQLWVDSVTQKVIQSQRGKKKLGTLDDMLLMEQKRKAEFDRKYEATAELEKERKKKAQEKFKEAFTSVEED